MSGHYAYTFSSDAIDPLDFINSPPDWPAFAAKGLDRDMHYYTPQVHVAAFQLPAFVDRVVGQGALRPSLNGGGEPSDDRGRRQVWRERFMGLPQPMEQGRAETLSRLQQPVPLMPAGANHAGGSLSRQLGSHTIVELWGAGHDTLNDEQLMKQALLGAAGVGNLVVLESVFHSFDGQGVTGMLLLSTSHLTVHTWPEYGYAAVDLFTCSPIPVRECVRAALGPLRLVRGCRFHTLPHPYQLACAHRTMLTARRPLLVDQCNGAAGGGRQCRRRWHCAECGWCSSVLGGELRREQEQALSARAWDGTGRWMRSDI
jgi:S-adenosylmethionine decarboxylase